MASEDIIELGSSDDEAEPPAPKKIKPMPNAMVHIPKTVHEVTIKAVRTNSSVQFIKPSLKLLTQANKYTSNGIPLQNSTANTFIKKTMKRVLPHQNKLGVNPFHIKNSSQTGIVINKLSTKSCKYPIRENSTKVLNSLPPSITITRTQGAVKKIPIASECRIKVKKDLKLGAKVGDVLTVELDDDDASQSSIVKASPQWYLRPEEQCNENNLEKENNKEPEPNQMIEIIIEDSPVKSVKPVETKRPCEANVDTTITIDDSPSKCIGEKIFACSSDNEKSSKVPQSKKKLNYLKDSNDEQVNVIKIDQCAKSSENITNEIVNKNTIETSDKQISVTNKSNHEKDKIDKSPIENVGHKSDLPTKNSEFHPVYQKFIDLCFKLENSEDMNKIVEKKIKAYYRQVSLDYVNSEEFVDMVSSKISLINGSPEKMYLYIKDVVDDLDTQRKARILKPMNKIKNKPAPTEKEEDSCNEDTKYDRRRRRHIHKLEKTIKKLHRAIQKLEEQEVDFDDDEDSVYLLTERYKERMVRVYAKFCQLTNTKMPSEPYISIPSRPGQPSGPAKKIEKWINKKVPIGTPLPFPDFHDVIKCVREANKEDRLGWAEPQILEEARDLFVRCGRRLQRRRQENEWRLAASRMAQDVDPAENNEDLKKKLDDNKKVAAKKEIDLLNRYADKQNLLKLKAVEIGDIEADESPVESEDEVVDESISLKDKHKRKDKMRKFLREKSNKEIDEQELISCNEVKKDKLVVNEKENLSTKEAEKNVKDSCSLENSKSFENIEAHMEGNSEMQSKNVTIDNEIEIEKNTENLDHNPNNKKFNTCEVGGNKNYEQKSKVETEEINDTELKTDHESVTDIKGGEKIEEVTIELSDVECNDKTKSSRVLEEDNKGIDLKSDDLLEKLHSENEGYSSSLEYSDSESPISVSDTVEFNSETDNEKPDGDIISIEDSSYSESETHNDDISFMNFDIKSASHENEKIEHNLEEESKCNNEYINVRDDAITISETVVNDNAQTIGEDFIEINHRTMQKHDNSPDSISITETLISKPDQNIGDKGKIVNPNMKNDGKIKGDTQIITNDVNLHEIILTDDDDNMVKTFDLTLKDDNSQDSISVNEIVIASINPIERDDSIVLSDNKIPTKDNSDNLQDSVGATETVIDVVTKNIRDESVVTNDIDMIAEHKSLYENKLLDEVHKNMSKKIDIEINTHNNKITETSSETDTSTRSQKDTSQHEVEQKNVADLEVISVNKKTQVNDLNDEKSINICMNNSQNHIAVCEVELTHEVNIVNVRTDDSSSDLKGSVEK